MQKTLRILILSIILMTLFSISAYGADITEINQLIENAKALDGKQVSVKGETIGEVMQRSDYCWVNINDSTNAIGIWIKAEDAKQIMYYGNYKNTGDTIMVTGDFHRACIEHGGEADIHCDTLKIIKIGFPVITQIPTVRIIIAVILLALFVVCFAVYKFVMLKIPLNDENRKL